MSLINILEKRRSYYQINKDLPVVEKEVIQKIKQITELVPDAFNMKSSKIVVVLHEKQDELWNTIMIVLMEKSQKIRLIVSGRALEPSSSFLMK